MGTEESTEHLFTVCDFFANTRLQNFGTHEPPKETLKDIQTHQFVDFINLINWLPEEVYTPSPEEINSQQAESRKPP